MDLHAGGKLNLELSQDWIVMYLIKGLCGNTVVRFYSVVQHVYDSKAKLGGIIFHLKHGVNVQEIVTQRTRSIYPIDID